MSMKLKHTWLLVPILRTLPGEAMSATTNCRAPIGAQTSFGDTFGQPSVPTVANQQRTERLKQLMNSGLKSGCSATGQSGRSRYLPKLADLRLGPGGGGGGGSSITTFLGRASSLVAINFS